MGEAFVFSDTPDSATDSEATRRRRPTRMQLLNDIGRKEGRRLRRNDNADVEQAQN